MSTLVIVNPHAASGRALRAWTNIESPMWEALGDLVVAITPHERDVVEHLNQAVTAGIKRIITIGGDGTNHAMINALATLAQQQPDFPQLTLGSLPIGTGTDWARTVGTPLKPAEAVAWLKQAEAKPVDLGQLTHDAGSAYFLNIASAGISGEIDRRVNAQRQRRPWTFLTQTIIALLRYSPTQIRVLVDGQPWFEGKAFIVAVANGRAFGHGMMVAPDAKIDDGLFDVVVVDAMPFQRALRALPSLYTGKHLLRSDVHHARAAKVEVESAVPLSLDLDGEYSTGHNLRFTLHRALLNILQ